MREGRPGSQGLEVSAIDLGCKGMVQSDGRADEEESMPMAGIVSETQVISGPRWR